MLFDRQHTRSSTLGQAMIARTTRDRGLNWCLFAIMMMWMYIPTIGVMFLVMLLPPNATYISVCMDMFNLYRLCEGSDVYNLFIVIYPAFVGQYMDVSMVPFFLGVCESLKSLGHFMAMARWPNQMFCGDPMACWRSQYLYSHAIHYNCAG